ncbi:3-carboxy-cis,cis-muconate cycloisomerase [Actinoplanes sp. LDG1-06]|uniref:3-carboxy-cis,cis-muconate cycloisomerase n=1 Tax=Paractinoplanes ovalisporus TaxID=2810368 RepID=A0ABS2AVD5_9ACTN|nr:lyase family protein [Actinoplanes ovalisporus]MBM2623842.1 3-carboxy-cis,cis-muconate cycloisomerase [Actinoplanes ovalisporus]
MSDLLWPGDGRAGEICTDASVLAAMLRVESAWIDTDLSALAGPGDLPALAEAAEEGGNPVIPLLALLRSRCDDKRLHLGLTSQDVLDTALVLCLSSAAASLISSLGEHVAVLADLTDRHRHTDMAGRTLTQHAVPITFGLKVSTWLQGVLDARDALAAATLPIQIGGAAGSLAAIVAIEGSPDLAVARIAATAARLGLPLREPWHTGRAPLTRFGDALVTCTDAWGRIANDVLLLTRPEIGELSLAQGGGSSAMPNKRNPTLAVLVRRAALAGPPLAATLHTAAANMVDERPDGAWHVEWATVRTLSRRTVVAGSQTTDMLAGLRVDPRRMAATLDAARPGIDAEQRKYASSSANSSGANSSGAGSSGAGSSHGAGSSGAGSSHGAGSSGAGSSHGAGSSGAGPSRGAGSSGAGPSRGAGSSGAGPSRGSGSYRGATDQIIDAVLARAGE